MIDLKLCHRRRRPQSGFALIEILIAFVLAAVGLGLLYSGLAGAFRSDRRAARQISALRLAQSRLTSAGLVEPLRFGVREGDSGSYHWRQVTSRALPMTVAAPPSAPQVSTQAPTSELFWVSVEVKGRDGTTVELQAAKLSVGGQ